MPEPLRDLILKPPPLPPRALVAIKKITKDGSTEYDLTQGLSKALERRPILEVLEEMGRQVTPHGAYFKTNCIFHDDPGPSMVLYPQDDSFHCYGCEAHGDSINLEYGEDMTHRKILQW